LDARLTALLCEEITAAISNEVKAGWSNLQRQTSRAESSKKAMEQKGLFSNDGRDNDDDDDDM
jgi:hypothetical protein